MPAQLSRRAPLDRPTSTGPAAGPSSSPVVGNAAVAEQLRASPAMEEPSLLGAVAGDRGGARVERQDPIQAWAEQSLGSRFEIVAPGAQRTAGNQITADEYARLTSMYADIQRGRSDLRFDTNGMTPEQAAAFQGGAMADLADILQTASGRDLIRSLHDAPRHGLLGLGGDRNTWIGQHGPPGRPDPSNAFGGGDPGRRGMVQYVPRQNHGPNGELRSDVVLYHELVHAHHAVYDSWDHDHVSPDRGGSAIDVRNGVSESEHQAVGLGEHAEAPFSENRYRGERRAIGRRGVGDRRGDRGMRQRSDYLGFTQ